MAAPSRAPYKLSGADSTVFVDQVAVNDIGLFYLNMLVIGQCRTWRHSNKCCKQSRIRLN